MISDEGVEESGTTAQDLRWVWVAAGVAVGVVLLGTLVPLVRSESPRPDVAVLIGSLTFALMGILVGYKSPGETIREATVAGALLLILSFLAIGIGFDLPLTAPLAGAGVVAGLALSALGGWVGEILQGTLAGEARPGRVAWPWVLVGTVLGVLLTVHTVFVLQVVVSISAAGVLAGFLTSFLATGFFVGYSSPGFTILEPALAALLVVVIDLAVLAAGDSLPFSWESIAAATGAALVLALAGGYSGEVAAASRLGG